MNVEKLHSLLKSKTDNLRTLAGIAGGHASSFYRGANFDAVDLRGEDLRGFDLTGSSFLGTVYDDTTLMDELFRANLVNDGIYLFNSPYTYLIIHDLSDREFASRLHGRLKALGIRCSLEDHWIQPDYDRARKIDHDIQIHDKILLCMSRGSLNSWWMKSDVEQILEKEALSLKRREGKAPLLIPVILDTHFFGWKGYRATDVQSRFVANFNGWALDDAIFEAQFKSLFKSIQDDSENGKELLPPQQLPPGDWD